MADGIAERAPSREQLIHSLYEAAELEHNLMCTYLYAAFSLKTAGEGLSDAEVEAVARWKSEIIGVASVIDGDTLVVSKEGAGLATVRLLGIKAFEAKMAKDDSAVHGRAAEEALRRLATDQPLRVLLNTPPKDKHGRTLATLYVGGEDIGMTLVARGHALAYTVYPFAQMSAYLQAQAAAKAQRLGLWADPAVVERAEGLIREWARAAP